MFPQSYFCVYHYLVQFLIFVTIFRNKFSQCFINKIFLVLCRIQFLINSSSCSLVENKFLSICLNPSGVVVLITGSLCFVLSIITPPFDLLQVNFTIIFIKRVGGTYVYLSRFPSMPAFCTTINCFACTNKSQKMTNTSSTRCDLSRITFRTTDFIFLFFNCFELTHF